MFSGYGFATETLQTMAPLRQNLLLVQKIKKLAVFSWSAVMSDKKKTKKKDVFSADILIENLCYLSGSNKPYSQITVRFFSFKQI